MLKALANHVLHHDLLFSEIRESFSDGSFVARRAHVEMGRKGMVGVIRAFEHFIWNGGGSKEVEVQTLK